MSIEKLTKLKILYCSTCPFVNTGYGIVTRYVIPRLRLYGFDILVYCPQIVSQSIEWEYELSFEGMKVYKTVKFLPSLTPNPYDCDVIYRYYKMYERNLLITHWDVWVLHGLINRDVQWVPHIPIDAPLDEYTYEINNVLLANNVIAVITQSKFGFNEVRKIVGNSKPIFYIPHGVDTKLFKPFSENKRVKVRESLGLKPHGFYIGFVGKNESDRKDIVTLIKSFKLFVENYRDAKDVYLILWTNVFPKPGMSYDILRLVRRYNLEDRVLLPEKQPPEHHYDYKYLVNIYNCMDWYVTCSSGEGFGLPILEALACGVPVLAPHNSTHVELVVDTSEYPYPRGLTVKPKIVRPVLWTPTHQEYAFVDPWDFAQAINQIYNMGTPKKLRNWCREFALRYDWEKIIDEYWMKTLEEIAELLFQ